MIEAALLVGGRLLVGGVLAFMGLNHFLQTEQMAGYAEHKGLPAPTAGVLASGALLVAAGASVALGAFVAASAVVLAGFLVVSAVVFHDFWAVPEDQVQDEMTHFLKNLVMAGGALAVAALGAQGPTVAAAL